MSTSTHKSTSEDTMKPTDETVEEISVDETLSYIYDFEVDDDLTTSKEVTEAQAQDLEQVSQDGNDWHAKYNLPEPKEIHEFAENMYNNYGKLNSEIELIKNNWKLLYRVKGKVLKKMDGFYGELYFNTENHCLLISIKGTSTAGNVYTNVKNVVLKRKGGEINSAFTFGEKVRQLINKFKCKPILLITGHSLGGYLAQIITYTIINIYVDDDDKSHNVLYRNEPSYDFGIYTMVFDSPASFEQIRSIHKRDPLKMKRFDLPIVNFVKDVNMVNCNSAIGAHLGQVIAIQGFDQLGEIGKLERITNTFSSHRLTNFQDIKIEEWENVENLPYRRSVKYNRRIIPSCYFSKQNFMLLHKYLFLAEFSTDFLVLPKYKISEMCVILKENTAIEEFIPRVGRCMLQFKELIENGNSFVNKIIESEISNLWAVEMLEGAHDLSLNDEWKVRVQKWKDGTVIGGFQTQEEMKFIGYLLHNSIPRCLHYDYHKFNDLEPKVVEKFAATTEATFVLIVKDRHQIVKHQKRSNITIIYLVLKSDADENVTLNFSVLDVKSQKTLSNKKLTFMGNEVSANNIFGKTLFEELLIWDIMSFHKQASLQEELFYGDQQISNKKTSKQKFKSATDFARMFLNKKKLKFVLISSDAGMGKSTALKQIAKTLQNAAPKYWIVHLNLFHMQNELYNSKDTLITKESAVEIVRNAELAQQKDDKVLKKVFHNKIKDEKMIFLFDSLDEVCPLHRKTVIRFMKLLRETDLQMIVTTRPNEDKNFERAVVFELQPLQDKNEIKTFIYKRLEAEGKSDMTQDIMEWFEQLNKIIDSDFWHLPLSMVMVLSIYIPIKKIMNAESAFQYKTNIYREFLANDIKDTLEKKLEMEMDKTKAGKADDYNRNVQIYTMLMELLAICTIFHEGKVQEDVKKEIKKNGKNINRFSVVKLDSEYKQVTFQHKSYAEHLVATVYLKQLSSEPNEPMKRRLVNEQLKSILLQEEYSEIRKHICGILSASPKKLNFDDLFIKGDESNLLHILIKDDCFELYEQIKKLLTFKLNENMIVEEKCMHPLHLALLNSKQKFVRKLIEDGANFKEILMESFILHLAIQKGLYKEVVNHFEILKSNINLKNPQNTFPLHIAALKGNENIVKFLIENGADVNAESESKTALYYAIQANSDKVVELLIEKKANLETALHWAVLFNRKKLFNNIYENYSPQEDKAMRLTEAHYFTAYSGNVEMFEHLCGFSEANPTPLNINGDTFLHAAAANGHLLFMQTKFESHQQSVTIRNNSGKMPVMVALQNGHLEVAQYLLELDKEVINEVDNEGKTCLHYASQDGNLHGVKMCMNSGADVNVQDKNGRTALFLASQGSRLAKVEYLLKRFADANLKDNKGNACLHVACESNNVECVKLLLDCTPFNGENKNQEMPIHRAALMGNKKIVVALLQASDDHNKIHANGKTILRLAAKVKEYNDNDSVHDDLNDVNISKIKSEILSWRYTFPNLDQD